MRLPMNRNITNTEMSTLPPDRSHTPAMVTKEIPACKKEIATR